MSPSNFTDVSRGADFCNLYLVSSLVYYSALKIEAICSSETSVDFYKTAWRYIPGDRILKYADFVVLKLILRVVSAELQKVKFKWKLGRTPIFTRAFFINSPLEM
jgi:hypothetical protein